MSCMVFDWERESKARSVRPGGQPPTSFGVHSSMHRFCRIAALLFLSLAGLAWARPLYDFSATESAMQGMVGSRSLVGGSLRHAHRGFVVQQSHYGSFSNATRIPIASASKWLSGLVIARLVEKGQLAWDDTVGEWMPDAPAATLGITLTQLFSHTSGIAGNETTACLSSRFTTLDACARSILAAPLESTPGTAFAYGGNSMQVAGRLAELASGKDWNQVFFDELVAPLGLSATDFATSSTQAGYVWVNNPRIAGGVRSTLEDYGRVLDMVLADGVVGGQRFLRADTLLFMRQDQIAGKIILGTPSPETPGYGIGQWIEVLDAQGRAQRVSSPGAFGTTPWVDLACACAGIILVQDSRSRLVSDLYAIQNAAITAMSQWRYIKPPPSRPQVLSTSTAASENRESEAVTLPASGPNRRRGMRDTRGVDRPR